MEKSRRLSRASLPHPMGAAALRRAAESGLGAERAGEPVAFHLSPSRLLPFALMGALVCCLSGTGVLPLAVGAALELAALLCYLLALRSALPRWPPLPWPRARWLSGMEPALLPLGAYLPAAVTLCLSPGLPEVVLLPLWVLLALGLAPWLELEMERRSASRWGASLLALLTILAPLPVFVMALGPGVAAPLCGLGVALAALLPTWRLVTLSRPIGWDAAVRALSVALVIGAAAGLTALTQVPLALLPVALLLGWYGLAGVVSVRDGRPVRAFAGFVVLAAVLLAVSNSL